MVREIKQNELNELLQLYLFLHEETIPEMTKHLKDTWNTIIMDENHHIIVNEVNCYKMMLLTGSKKETTLSFYSKAGYNSTDKTSFIQWPE